MVSRWSGGGDCDDSSGGDRDGGDACDVVQRWY